MQTKSPLQFFQLEAAGGFILFIAALIAVFWANSPLAFIHAEFVDVFLFWINDGLMSIFFLLVSLELKREFVTGTLKEPAAILLPLVAALGGMLVPALIYISINHANPIALKGWSSPVATDIAFALGVLSLFGRAIPRSIKLFLLALAIFDDIGAIIIIALFYSHGLSALSILLAAILTFILFLLNTCSVRHLGAYLFFGACLWGALVFSGLHPTLAGVLLAMAIPAEDSKGIAPLNRLEAKLHPWVAFLIMPLFALANAGFSLHGLISHALTEMVLGIVLGLFVGKQIGVFLFSWCLIQLKFAKLPEKATWLQLYGVALLCGIGFTMSLFLGTLSFQNEGGTYLAEVRIGVAIASILSGLAGALVLWLARTDKQSTTIDQETQR